jgi:hypothetical protein
VNRTRFWRRTGGQHHAYIIKLVDYEPWLEHFRAHDLPARQMAHGLIRLSMYVDDPDGYHIELTVPFDDAEVARREIEKRGLLQGADRRPPWRRSRTWDPSWSGRCAGLAGGRREAPSLGVLAF